jgi:hypothetical protein
VAIEKGWRKGKKTRFETAKAAISDMSEKERRALIAWLKEAGYLS